MSGRGLLVLVLLLAAAVSALVWLGRAPAPTPSAAPEGPLFAKFAEDAVRELELKCGETRVTLKRAPDSGWTLTSPIGAEADSRRVHELLAALQNARIRKVIASGATDLTAFGLSPAVCTVRVDLGAAAPARSVRIGRNSPVGGERYAATDDSRVVFTDGSLYGAVSRGAEAFREKRLLPFEPAAITKISLSRPSDKLTLAMTDGGCRLLAPVVDAGSSAACEELARAVTSIEPAGDKQTIRIELETKGGTTPTVAFAAAAPELERPADSFRDTHVISFSTPDVRGVTIERGTMALRVARAGEAAPWTGTEGALNIPVDASRVAALLDNLRGLTAAGFDSAIFAKEPIATVTVAGEHAELARLTFGNVWVTTPARPGTVFRVEASAISSIPKTASDLAPAPPVAH